jgi:phosphoribosyl 1,2-cyclic phosphodiesterase
VLFDLGTGLRYFGLRYDATSTFAGTALLTHLHWDHTQGLPFFVPLLRPDTTLDVYGPAQDDGRTLHDLFGELVRPPQFPVTIDQFPGHVQFHDIDSADWSIGPIQVMARPVPHVGRTIGYRMSWHGASVAYIPDHQQPAKRSDGLVGSVTTDAVLELVDGVDLLIHDAQYTPEGFERKSTWGHCTFEYAVEVAAAGGAKRLALFHHDPSHDDEELDRIERCAVELGDAHGIEVFAARERMSVSLPASATP